LYQDTKTLRINSWSTCFFSQEVWPKIKSIWLTLNSQGLSTSTSLSVEQPELSVLSKLSEKYLDQVSYFLVIQFILYYNSEVLKILTLKQRDKHALFVESALHYLDTSKSFHMFNINRYANPAYHRGYLIMTKKTLVPCWWLYNRGILQGIVRCFINSIL
jgi:hypothetical protein